jgi:hypothetical protein
MTALHGDVGEALSADPDSTEPTQPGASLPWWSAIAWSRTWTDAVLPTILLRAVLLGFGFLAVVIFRGDAWQGSLTEIWNRWDAPHFIEIARYGYAPPAEDARIVLLPVFPILIRMLWPFIEPTTAGMLIAFVATLAAAAGLYRLARLDHGRRAARWAVIAMSVFPTAFTLVAPYSEGPFLAFAIWAFVRARADDWRGAGVLTFLAAATRIQGAFLIPALALEYWLTRRRIDRDAGWLLLGLGAPLLYLAINYVTFGDPLFFLEIQRRVFNVTTIAPWAGIAALIQNGLAFKPTESWATVYLAPLAGVVVLAVVTLWTVMGRGGRPSYFLYAGLTLLSFVALSWPISTPRYLMGVFPLFLALGRLGARPSIGPPVFVASTLLLAAFVTLFLIGHWAF